MEKERILYLDVIKGFAILLVVYGHILQYSIKSDFISNPIWEIIYAFHMPLFMTVSGYFAGNLLKRDIKDFMWKIFHSYLLPLIFWSVICSCFILFVFPDGREVTSVEIVRNIIFGFFGNYWFLRELSVIFLLFYFTIKICKRKVLHSFILSMLIILIFPSREENFSVLCKFSPVTDYTINLLPFVYLGYFIKRHTYLLEKKWPMLSIPLCIVSLVFWDGQYTIYFSPIYNVFYMFYNNTIPDNINIVLYRYSVELVCCIAIWLICYKLFKYLPNSGERFLKLTRVDKIGQNTIGIYLMQGILVEMAFEKYMMSTCREGILLLPCACIITYCLYRLTAFIKTTRFKWIFG